MIESSLELNELFAALSKAQGEYKPVVLTGTSSQWGPYAKLIDMRRASDEALTKHGLSVNFVVLQKDNEDYLATILAHSSGQVLVSLIKMRYGKDGAHAVGSLFTYMKRYTYAAITGLAVDDVDDDGDAAEGKKTVQANKADNTKKNAFAESDRMAEYITDVANHIGEPAWSLVNRSLKEHSQTEIKYLKKEAKEMLIRALNTMKS